MRPGERRTARLPGGPWQGKAVLASAMRRVPPSAPRPCAGGGIGLAISVIPPAGGMTARSRGGCGGLRRNRGEEAQRRRGLSPMTRAGIPAAIAGPSRRGRRTGSPPDAPSAGLERALLAWIVPIAAEWPALGLPCSYMPRGTAVKECVCRYRLSRLPGGPRQSVMRIEAHVPKLSVMRSVAAD
jgi:hypothetical protein